MNILKFKITGHRMISNNLREQVLHCFAGNARPVFIGITGSPSAYFIAIRERYV